MEFIKINGWDFEYIAGCSVLADGAVATETYTETEDQLLALFPTGLPGHWRHSGMA